LCNNSPQPENNTQLKKQIGPAAALCWEACKDACTEVGAAAKTNPCKAAGTGYGPSAAWVRACLKRGKGKYDEEN
jgi:hypothetical protein